MDQPCTETLLLQQQQKEGIEERPGGSGHGGREGHTSKEIRPTTTATHRASSWSPEPEAINKK
jgi:hypothetical protein